MAALTDSMGNTINSSIQDLKAAMTGPVKQSFDGMTTGINNANIPAIASALSALESRLKTDFQAVVTQLNAAVTAITNAKSSGSGGNKIESYVKKIEACLCRAQTSKMNSAAAAMKKKLQQSNTWDGLGDKLDKVFKKQKFWEGLIKALNTKFVPKSSGTTPSPSPSPNPSPTPSPSPSPSPSPGPTDSGDSGGGSGFSSDFERYFIGDLSSKFLAKIQDITSGFENIFFKFGEKINLQSMLFEGMATQEMNFVRSIRETAFEIEGINGEARKAQENFYKIGESVEETGVNRTKFQEEYLKNLRSGLRDTKTLQFVTKQTLATEKMLGFQAGELTEHFREQVLANNMNNAQIGAIGRGMQSVSRATGLTGEKLKAAVDSSKEFMTAMRNAATLTAAAANNVTHIVAESQKMGVGDQVGTLLKAVTSTTNLINDSSQQTQAFLYNAASNVGKISELQYGILTRSKKGLKDLAAGMEQTLQSFGVRSMEEIENLPDEVKFKLNLQLKGAFGMELGEITRTVQAFKEAGKGVSEKLSEINAKRRLSLSIEEKAQLNEQENQLKRDAALNVLTGFSEATKGAQSMDIAFSNFSRRAEEFRDDIGAFGGDMGSLQGGVKSAITSATDSLNQALIKQGEKPIQIDSSEIEAALNDKKQYDVLIERLEAGNKKLQTAQKAATDPTLQTARTLEKYNDYFRNSYAQPLLVGLTALVGFSGIMATALTLIASKMALSAGIGAKKYGDDLLRLLGMEGGGSKKGRKKRGSGGGDGGGDVSCPVPTMQMDVKKLAKNVALLGGVGIALVALSGVLLYLGSFIPEMSYKEIFDTVAKVTVLMTAGAFLMAQSAVAFLALDKANQMFGSVITWPNLKRVIETAAILSALGAALVALSFGVISLAYFLTSMVGLDSSTIKEVVLRTTLLIAGTLEIIGALLLSATALLGVGLLLNQLAPLTPLVVFYAAAATLLLPILAGAFLAMGMATMVFLNDILGLTNLDSADIEELIYKFLIISGGIIIIIAALAEATLAIAGMGLFFATMPATIGAWTVALWGIGALVVVGLAIVGIAWALTKFFGYLGEVDTSSITNGADTAYAILDTINGILLRLTPALAIIGLIAVAAGVMQAFFPAVIAAMPLMAWTAVALMGLSLVLPPILTLMARAIIGMVAGIASSFPIDESTKKDIEAFNAIMDTCYQILIKLAPLAALIGLMAGAATALAMFGGPAILLLAGFAVLISASLPAIIGYLVQIATGVIDAVKAATMSFNVDKKQADELANKIESVGYAVKTIGGAVGKMIGKDLFVAAANIAMVTGQMGAFLKAAAGLGASLSSSTATEMKDIADKLGSVFLSMLAITGILKMVSMDLGTKYLMHFTNAAQDLTSFTTTLNDIRTPLLGLTDALVYIGEQIRVKAAGLNIKQSAETQKEILSFTKNMVKFTNQVATMSFSKKFEKKVDEITKKGSLVRPVKNMFGEVKKLAEVHKTVGINRKDLYMSAEMMEQTGKFMEHLGKITEGFAKAATVLAGKDKKYQLPDTEIMKQNLTKVLGFVDKISAAVYPWTTDSSVGGDMEDSLVFLGKMAPLFDQFGATFDSFTKGAQKIIALNTGTGWGWWSKPSIFEQLQEEVTVGGENMSKFAGTIEIMFKGFKEIVDKSIEGKRTASEIETAKGVMVQVTGVMDSFTQAASSFGKKMGVFFNDPSWYNFIGTQGGGQTIIELKDKIQRGFTDIFGILKHIQTVFSSFEVGSAADIKSKSDQAVAFMGTSVQALNTLVDGFYGLNDVIKGGKAGWWSGPKFAAYEFLQNDSIWNEYKKNFDLLKYIPVMFEYITNPLQGALDKYANGMSTSELQSYLKSMLDIIQVMAVFPDALRILMDKLYELNKVKMPTQKDADLAKTQGSSAGVVMDAFGFVMKEIGKANIDKSSVESAQEKLKLVDSVLSPFINTIKNFENIVYTPVNTGKGMLAPANQANMAEVGKSINGFFGTVIGMLKNINDSGDMKIEDYKTTIEKLKLLSGVSESLAGGILNFYKNMHYFNVIPEGGKNTIAEQVVQDATKISDAILSIGSLIDTLKTAVRKIPAEQELTSITQKLTGLSSAAEGIKTLFDSVNKTFVILNDKTTFGDVSLLEGVEQNLKQNGAPAAASISKVIGLIATNMVLPILTMKAEISKGKFAYIDSDDLEESAKMLTHLSNAMKSMQVLFDTSSKMMTGLWSQHKVQQDFNAAAGKVDPNAAAPPATPKNLEKTGSTMQRLEEMLKNSAPSMKAIFQAFGGIIGIFGQGVWANIDSDDVAEVSKILKGVSDIFELLGGKDPIFVKINNALKQAREIQDEHKAEWTDMEGLPAPEADSLPDGFVMKVESLAGFVKELIDPISMIVFVMDSMNIGGVGIDSSDIAEAGKMLTGLKDMFTSLPDLIKLVNEKLPDLMKQASSIDAELAKAGGATQAERGKAIGNLLTNTFAFLGGIFQNVVMRFEDAPALDQSADLIRQMVPFTNSLVGNLPTLSSNMKMIVAVDLTGIGPIDKKVVNMFFQTIGDYAQIILSSDPDTLSDDIYFAQVALDSLGIAMNDFYVSWLQMIPDTTNKMQQMLDYDFSRFSYDTEYYIAHFLDNVESYAWVLSMEDYPTYIEQFYNAVDNFKNLSNAIDDFYQIFMTLIPDMVTNMTGMLYFDFSSFNENQTFGIGSMLGTIDKFVTEIESYNLTVLTDRIYAATDGILNVDQAMLGLIDAYSQLGGTLSSFMDIDKLSALFDGIKDLNFATSFVADGQVAVAGGEIATRQEVSTRMSMNSGDLVDSAASAAMMATANNTGIMVLQNEAIIGLLGSIDAQQSSGGSLDDTEETPTNNYMSSKYLAYQNLAGSNVLGSPNFGGRKGSA